MDTRQVEKMAWYALRQHGLRQDGWTFEWDNAKRRAGVCRYDRKVIGLSRGLMALWDEGEVRDTILHEVAHALCPGDGHGPEWKATCRRIGAKPKACYSADRPQVDAPWVGYCPNGHRVTKHRRPTRVDGCGRCPGRGWKPEHVIIWWYRGVPVDPADISPSYAREWRIAGQQYGADKLLASLDAVRAAQSDLQAPAGVSARPLAAAASTAAQRPPVPASAAYAAQDEALF